MRKSLSILDSNSMTQPDCAVSQRSAGRCHAAGPSAGILRIAIALSLVSVAVCSHAAVWTVHPDGSGDFPTIQVAIDAALPGDVIELADGVFRGPGNRDLLFGGKAVTLRSSSGDPAACVIDCEGSPIDPHRGVLFRAGDGPATVVNGITIANGYAERGGGVIVEEGALPRLERCVITGNAAVEGGGVYRDLGTPELMHVTISGNLAERGGGLASRGGGAGPILRHSILWGNCAREEGPELYLDNGSVRLICSCFGYPGFAGSGVIFYEDWFFDDPLYCGAPECTDAPLLGGDYAVSVNSPVLPANAPCGDLVGALDAACEGPTPVLLSTWGGLKAGYREDRSRPAAGGSTNQVAPNGGTRLAGRGALYIP